MAAAQSNLKKVTLELGGKVGVPVFRPPEYRCKKWFEKLTDGPRLCGCDATSPPRWYSTRPTSTKPPNGSPSGSGSTRVKTVVLDLDVREMLFCL